MLRFLLLSASAGVSTSNQRATVGARCFFPPPVFLTSSTPPPTKNPGRLVQYQSGNVTRVGRIVQLLRTEQETSRPPKVVYECWDAKKKVAKRFTNNPSMLTVLPEPEEGGEGVEKEEEEEELGGMGEEEEGEGEQQSEETV